MADNDDQSGIVPRHVNHDSTPNAAVAPLSDIEDSVSLSNDSDFGDITPDQEAALKEWAIAAEHSSFRRLWLSSSPCDSSFARRSDCVYWELSDLDLFVEKIEELGTAVPQGITLEIKGERDLLFLGKAFQFLVLCQPIMLGLSLAPGLNQLPQVQNLASEVGQKLETLEILDVVTHEEDDLSAFHQLGPFVAGIFALTTNICAITADAAIFQPTPENVRTWRSALRNASTLKSFRAFLCFETDQQLAGFFSIFDGCPNLTCLTFHFRDPEMDEGYPSGDTTVLASFLERHPRLVSFKGPIEFTGDTEDGSTMPSRLYHAICNHPQLKVFEAFSIEPTQVLVDLLLHAVEFARHFTELSVETVGLKSIEPDKYSWANKEVWHEVPELMVKANSDCSYYYKKFTFQQLETLTGPVAYSQDTLVGLLAALLQSERIACLGFNSWDTRPFTSAWQSAIEKTPEGCPHLQGLRIDGLSLDDFDMICRTVSTFSNLKALHLDAPRGWQKVSKGIAKLLKQLQTMQAFEFSTRDNHYGAGNDTPPSAPFWSECGQIVKTHDSLRSLSMGLWADTDQTITEHFFPQIVQCESLEHVHFQSTPKGLLDKFATILRPTTAIQRFVGKFQKDINHKEIKHILIRNRLLAKASSLIAAGDNCHSTSTIPGALWPHALSKLLSNEGEASPVYHVLKSHVIDVPGNSQHKRALVHGRLD